MLLKKPTQAGDHDEANLHSPCHPFLYARVIGIYHANIVYTGPGMIDYNPIRFDFLWVRWYKEIPGETTTMSNRQLPFRLHQLTFPPMADDGSFGFVDPADVLRSCHIIPAFSQGNFGDLGGGMSKCARDSKDWKAYYVGQ